MKALRLGPRRLLAIAGLAAMLPAAGGCGYHLAGRAAILPPGTRVIAVLPFANHTRQPQLSQAISAAVARALQLRTDYQIQTRTAGSNVVIHGDLLSVQETPVTFDSTSGRAATVEVVIHMAAWVTSEPDGKELFRNPDLVFHDQYEISPQQQTFFEEDTAAFQRLSRAAGNTLVADILEAF